MCFGAGINNLCVDNEQELLNTKGVEDDDSHLLPKESSGWWCHLLTRGQLGKDQNWGGGCV